MEVNLDKLQLLVQLHKGGLRQGPGGDAETRMAIELAHLKRAGTLKVADIGCGTGASTILLSKELDAEITAVDFLPEFLDELKLRAEVQGVAEKITTINCSMDSLPFRDNEFDLIWSEGAIYNLGFEAGVSSWRRFLKQGGKIVVSEITWITSQRPQEIQDHWYEEYPEIDTAATKIEILETNGFCLEAYFHLPPNCWLDNYYLPMEGRFQQFLEENIPSPEAEEIVESEKSEIALYKKYQNYYSYGFYIGKKI